jgi:hypothetical protein
MAPRSKHVDTYTLYIEPGEIRPTAHVGVPRPHGDALHGSFDKSTI